MPPFRMPNHILFDLQQHGYLSRVSTLRGLGHSRDEILAAVNSGVMVRVARDWVATSSASQLAIVAVGHGGKLTGTTALASLGVWDAVDRRIHVALRPNAHGSRTKLAVSVGRFARPRLPPGRVELHWRRELAPDVDAAPWRVSVIDALALVELQCAPDQFVACVDSALHTGQLSRAALPILFSALPFRASKLLALVNPLAESGLESLARQRLTGIAKTIELQVPIAGIGKTGGSGRVDLLLDSWLVVELDGDEFHDPVVD
jgi:hypothetical protein